MSATRPAGPAGRQGGRAGQQVRREYGFALLAGAAGAALILLAARQRWAQAVFTPPKPLTPQVVNVSGADLVPLAGALAVAALACLAAVIATRGALRRAAGVLLALFGAGAGAAIMTSVTAATVINVAASKVASPESAAVSGAAGSTTSGSAGGGALVVSGTPGHVAVLIGALRVFIAGRATARRGPDGRAMSARYDAPATRDADGRADATSQDGADGTGGPGGAGANKRQPDAATMWESLSGGEDPTEDDPPENAAEKAPPSARTSS